MHEATKAFRNAGPDASKTFIFTGNALNTATLPQMLIFGLGKVGPSYAIKYVVEQNAYKDDGINSAIIIDYNADCIVRLLESRFYYADERTIEGAPAYRNISGEAHAEEYLKIADRKDQGPWWYTFVKGTGYKDFEGKVKL
ncbi:hypothetical protein CLCR_03708 [Cladophialophora carrionii]|uniref:Uncharacterized protein n=1 Tax=Cladophialophora carrionii TaxID=86049 RepID=A0A1C1CGW5_9EURO|nr:hypothetical protein CLCR_03708 [Cladophialophora carrionii]